MFLDQKMRNRDLPVTKSLPSYMYTYVLVKLYLYLYLYPLQYLSTYLVVLTYLQYITWPGGEAQDHVLYIFLVRHASFINFLFFPFLFVARGIQKLLTYLPTLPGFFSWMPFTVFILGKVGTVVGSSSLRGRKLAGWLVGWLAGW